VKNGAFALEYLVTDENSTLLGQRVWGVRVPRFTPFEQKNYAQQWL